MINADTTAKPITAVHCGLAVVAEEEEEEEGGGNARIMSIVCLYQIVVASTAVSMLEYTKRRGGGEQCKDHVSTVSEWQ